MNLIAFWERSSQPDLYLDAQNAVDLYALIIEALTGMCTESPKSITHLIKVIMSFL